MTKWFTDFLSQESRRQQHARMSGVEGAFCDLSFGHQDLDWLELTVGLCAWGSALKTSIQLLRVLKPH